MDDHTYVHVQVSGQLPEQTGHLVLELKLFDAARLLWEHELHVVNANQLDVIGVDGVLKRLKHEFVGGGAEEVHEVEGVLFEVLKEQVQPLFLLVGQVFPTVLLKHGHGQNFIPDFKTPPKCRNTLRQEVNGQLSEEGCLAGASSTCDQCQLAPSETFECPVVEGEILRLDAWELVEVKDSSEHFILDVTERYQVLISNLSCWPFEQVFEVEAEAEGVICIFGAACVV